MQYFWREISKDNIGIDGEIDLLESRPDGKGAIATGKIIKVQAKSGSAYLKRILNLVPIIPLYHNHTPA